MLSTRATLFGPTVEHMSGGESYSCKDRKQQEKLFDFYEE